MKYIRISEEVKDRLGKLKEKYNLDTYGEAIDMVLREAKVGRCHKCDDPIYALQKYCSECGVELIWDKE